MDLIKQVFSQLGASDLLPPKLPAFGGHSYGMPLCLGFGFRLIVVFVVVVVVVVVVVAGNNDLCGIDVVEPNSEEGPLLQRRSLLCDKASQLGHKSSGAPCFNTSRKAIAAAVSPITCTYYRYFVLHATGSCSLACYTRGPTLESQSRPSKVQTGKQGSLHGLTAQIGRLYAVQGQQSADRKLACER